MIICDRQNFIDCVNGDLLIRDAQGRITHLGDAATDAVAAHNRGETVYLTVHGRIVSKISNYVEEIVE